MSVTIQLPPQREQIAFHLKRWEELSRDESLADLDQRIETDRFGHVIMSPYASGWHGRIEMKIGILLDQLLGGEPVTECPITTSDGVKLADVGWFSGERFAEVREHAAFPKAPEICVEVISPSNSRSEILEKRQLYFEACCREFWTCNREGEMAFFSDAEGEEIQKSKLCPEFPNRIEL